MKKFHSKVFVSLQLSNIGNGAAGSEEEGVSMNGSSSSGISASDRKVKEKYWR